MKNQKSEIIKIKYNSSVCVDAGWRSVTIVASALKTSAKMCKVTEVLLIDDEAPVGYTSRTGAKRQRYNAASIAQREISQNKRLSACEIITD